MRRKFKIRTEKVNVIEKKKYVNSRILLLEVEIDSDVYVLVNLYNNDTEPYPLSISFELNSFFQLC